MTPQEKLTEIKIDRKAGLSHLEHVDWLIARVEQLEEALEYYAGYWGEHHGSPIKKVNQFTQNRLNETRYIAIKAFETMP